MSQLEKLVQHRKAILLAEIGAWLHMLGKYDWQFIKKQCGGNTSYKYQNFVSESIDQYPQLLKLLDTRSSAYKTILSSLPITTPDSIGAFICDHRKTTDARDNELGNQLTMLLVDAHGRGSNIEKSELRINFQGQSIPNIYLSTAFGYSRNLTEDDYETNSLHELLDELLKMVSVSSETERWEDLQREIRHKLPLHFQNALAETRIPFNDVTLLDQTASTVAFFKAALAERVVDGCWKQLMNNSTNQYKWRTLAIPFAGLTYLHTVSGISDLLGRKEILTTAQNAVQELLEITYPVGQEIYRDEQCSLFLVPDEENLLKWQNSKNQSLQDLIQQSICKATKGDILPDLENSLLPRGTRTLYTIGQQINLASSANITSDVNTNTTIKKSWKHAIEQQICTNCGLHPQGPSDKASSRKICDLCLKRRADRSKTWISNQFNQTVWIDEVADINGRLALLVGSWDLTEWLDGTLVNSIIAAPDIDFKQLEQDCCTSLGRTKKGHPQSFKGELQNLLIKHVRKQFNDQFRNYFDAIIQPEWGHLAGSLKEETIAAIHFVRQNPSFARLRRIWETTQTFWQIVLDEKDAVGNPILPTVDHRLEIIPKDREKLDLGFYQVYDLRLDNEVKLDVIWDPKNKRFVTCDNLEYLAKPELLGKPVNECLKGKLILEESSGYGSQNKKGEHITVEQVNKLENSSYQPTIPILAEPRTFMALVPANRALDIMQAIKIKYEREMGKVRNRLPLHLGAVYFHRRTPLRAALDAGRRMLKYDLGALKDEIWTVTNVDSKPSLPDGLAEGTQQFNNTVAVTIENADGRSLTWYVPAKMGDGTTDDKWYPYVFVPWDASGRQLVFKALRPKSDGTSEECWLVHAVELYKGDQVYFTPPPSTSSGWIVPANALKLLMTSAANGATTSPAPIC